MRVAPLITLVVVTIAAFGRDMAADSTPHEVMAAPAAPTHSITPLGECHVIDVVWSDDSTRAYVSMHVTAMDVWPVIVRYWPELVSIALGGVLLVVLLLLCWRRWRRRRMVVIGEPYCARCGYQLTGRDGAALCPECGRSLSGGGVVRGRRLSRWPVVVTVLLLTALGSGYVVGRSRLPRSGSASAWFHWPSARAYLWASKRQYWSLISVPTKRVRIVAVDPRAGRIVRTIFDKPATRGRGGEWYPRITRAFDADHLLLRGTGGVAEVAVHGGGITREWTLPADLLDARFNLCDVAVHPTKPLLFGYVGWKTIGAWDLQTGAWTELETFPIRSAFLMHSLYVDAARDTVWLRRVLDQRSPESGFDLVNLATMECALSIREPKHDRTSIVNCDESGLVFTSTEFAGVLSQNVTEQLIHRWLPGMEGSETQLSVPMRRITAISVGAQTGRLFLSGRPAVSGVVFPIVVVIEPEGGAYRRAMQSPLRSDVGMSVSPDESWVITTVPGEMTGASLFVFDVQSLRGELPAQ